MIKKSVSLILILSLITLLFAPLVCNAASSAISVIDAIFIKDGKRVYSTGKGGLMSGGIMVRSNADTSCLMIMAKFKDNTLRGIRITKTEAPSGTAFLSFENFEVCEGESLKLFLWDITGDFIPALSAVSLNGGDIGKNDDYINVRIDGNAVYMNQWPILAGETVLVPMKIICNKLGIISNYDSTAKKVSAEKGEKSLSFVIGKDKATVNGTEEKMNVPTVMFNGNVMIPFDLLCNVFDYSAEWNKTAKSVNIFTIDKDVLASLKKIDSKYDASLLDWIISLYDKESGGFYYAASARDTEGFEPDIESTYQAISGILFSAGICQRSYIDSSGQKAGTANGVPETPEYFRSKAIKFMQDRQDPDDGYFYDKQFGKNVVDSKRERNLDQGKNLLAGFDVKPLYPLPYERVSVNENLRTADGDSALPIQYTSETEFKKWADALPWTTDPYYCGNAIVAGINTINGSGLTEYVVKYITDRQNKATGMWGDECNFPALNAAMKFSYFYNNDTIPYPNVENMLKSVVEIVKNETPSTLSTTWNPLALIRNARNSFPERKFPPELQKLINPHYTELFNILADRVDAFKQPDNGYGYFTYGSSAKSQEVTVSLGLREGDVNGTYLALLVRESAYNLAGISLIPLFDTEKERFWEKIEKVKPIIKVSH